MNIQTLAKVVTALAGLEQVQATSRRLEQTVANGKNREPAWGTRARAASVRTPPKSTWESARAPRAPPNSLADARASHGGAAFRHSGAVSGAPDIPESPTPFFGRSQESPLDASPTTREKPSKCCSSALRQVLVVLLVIVCVALIFYVALSVEGQLREHTSLPYVSALYSAGQLADPHHPKHPKATFLKASILTLSAVAMAVPFFIYTCCWTFDSDWENFELGAEVKGDGRVVVSGDQEIKVLSTSSGEVELRLDVPNRCANLVFKHKVDGSEKEICGSIVRRSNSATNDGNFHITDYELIGGEVRSGKAGSQSEVEYHIKLNDSGSACIGQGEFSLANVKGVARNTTALWLLFAPSRGIAIVRKSFANCWPDTPDNVDSPDSVDSSDSSPKKENDVLAFFCSYWDLILIATLWIVFVVITWNKTSWSDPAAGTDAASAAETDPAGWVLGDVDQYEKYILISFAWAILVWHFSGAIIKCEKAAETGDIGRLPRFGTFLAVVLGGIGKGIRFVINKGFTNLVPGLNKEKSDDFLVGWIFIEFFLIFTLYSCNILLAWLGCDFKPLNIMQACGHVQALGYDVMIKCFVALVLKAFYTYVLSDANSNLHVASWARKWTGGQLGIFLAACHSLLDMRQQNISAKTPDLTALWRQVIRSGKEEPELGCICFQTMVISLLQPETTPQKWGDAATSHLFRDVEKKPGFFLSAFAKVEEAADINIVTDALIRKETPKCLTAAWMLLVRCDEMRRGSGLQ